MAIQFDMFRELGPEEEEQFRQWARDNYCPFSEINGVWHPAVVDECAKINRHHKEWQEYKDNHAEQWRKACEWDKIDPNEKFVIFSEDNPHAY
jgi:hypothetical protein